MPTEPSGLPRPQRDVFVSVLFGERCLVLRGCVSTTERRVWIEGLAHELLPDYEICNELAVERMLTSPSG